MTTPIRYGYTAVAGSASTGAWQPTDHSFRAWNADVYTAPGGAVPTVAGRLELVRVHLSAAAPITNVCLGMTAAGATLTAGQNFAALYTAVGVRVGVTADQSTAWASGLGIKQMALTGGPFQCAAGDYYVAWWFNGTTSPGWLRFGALGGGYYNPGLTSPNLRVATADTGLTTAAPANFGAQTAGAFAWWAALS